MPAQSKAQQRFMGMVHAAQKGDMENPSPEVEKAADSMSDKDAKDFASTKHDGLPDHVKEFIIREVRGIKTISKEYGDVVDQIQKHLDLYKQTKGTPAQNQHIQQLKQLNDKKKALAAELDQKVSGLYKDAELKVDEMNTSAAAGPYNTPFAFSGKDSEAKKGKKQADLTGYTVVKENILLEKQFKGLEGIPPTTPLNKASKDQKLKIIKAPGNIIDFIVPKGEKRNFWQVISTGKIKKNLADEYVLMGKVINSPSFKSVDDLIDGVNWKSMEERRKFNSEINENRWRDIKKEDAPATTKVNKGIANINHQLAEIEKFLGWYGKLKAENGVNNGNFWKRTNNHIYTIKERLLNLERQVRKISE